MITSNIEKGSREEFLNILAHELRNPLATIQSTVELMKARGMDAKETLEHLDVVDNQVNMIAILLNDLLDASRIPGSKFKYGEKRGVGFKAQPPLSTTAELSTVGRNKKSRVIPTKSPLRGKALRVLLVDDNETAADSMSELLALRGYDVEVAYSGAQAIEKARTFRPQVSILDIGMPGIDGYQLVAMLRKEDLSCSFIALTGYGQDKDKQKASNVGFDFHLTKPSRIKDIDAILQQVASATEKEVV